MKGYWTFMVVVVLAIMLVGISKRFFDNKGLEKDLLECQQQLEAAKQSLATKDSHGDGGRE